MFSTTHSRCGLARAERTLFRFLVRIGSVAALAASLAMSAQIQPISPQTTSPPTVIVVGFVGGFVRDNDDRHPEVQMMHRLEELDTYGLHAATFENRDRERAREEIVHWLDTNDDGQLSAGEKRNAQIILLGHSWGGSAVIRLANELNESGIPVLMTIQLDSINKGPGDDCVVPPNVAQALNFYQTRGLLHGCQALRPVDASRTRLLGNLRFEYAAQPAACRSYSWFNRHIFKTHNAMDCDSQVWAIVEGQIQTQLHNLVRGQPMPLAYLPPANEGFTEPGAKASAEPIPSRDSATEFAAAPQDVSGAAQAPQ